MNAASESTTKIGQTILMAAFLLVLLSCLLTSEVYSDSQPSQYKEYEVKAAFMYNFLKFIDWPEDKTAKGSGQIIIGILGQNPFGPAADILKDKKVEERNVVIKYFESIQQFKDAAEKDKAELTEKIKALTESCMIHRDSDGKIVIEPVSSFGELKNITDGAARAAKIEDLKKRGYLLADPSKPNENNHVIDAIADGQMDVLKKCHLLFICPSEKKNFSQIIDAVKDRGVLTVSDSQGFLEAGGIINFVIEDNKVRFNVNLTASETAGLKIRSQLLRLAKKVLKDGAEISGLSDAAKKEAN